VSNSHREHAYRHAFNETGGKPGKQASQGAAEVVGVSSNGPDTNLRFLILAL
jgi:hypothetical protein